MFSPCSDGSKFAKKDNGGIILSKFYNRIAVLFQAY